MMKALILAALLAFSALANASYREIELAASAARTTTGVGSSVDSLPDQIDWIDPGGRVLVRITAVSGTSPTLVVNLQCVFRDGVGFVTLGSSASLNAVGDTTFVVERVCRTIRATWTIGGTTPSFTFSVDLVRQ